MSAGLERLKQKLRTHAAAAIEAGRAQARKEAETMAQIMRAAVPVKEGTLQKTIRVEDTDTITLSGRTKGAYASREGNRSAGYNSTNNTADFIGVLVKAGDETTVVGGEKPGKKSGVRRGTKFQNAKLQEFGTKNMPANPFFFFAYRQRKRAAKANISRAISKAWKAGG